MLGRVNDQHFAVRLPPKRKARISRTRHGEQSWRKPDAFRRRASTVNSSSTKVEGFEGCRGPNERLADSVGCLPHLGRSTTKLRSPQMLAGLTSPQSIMVN